MGREGPVLQVPTALLRCVGSVVKRLRSRTSTSAHLCDDMNMFASCFDRIGTDMRHLSYFQEVDHLKYSVYILARIKPFSRF